MSAADIGAKCWAKIPAEAGIGLRFAHHREVIERRPDVAWLEVHTENYMGGGTNLRSLEIVRETYPVSLHGVGLSLGSAQGLDTAHLARIKALADRIDPGFVSEHLSWSIVDETYLPDLLPLPMTEEALRIVCGNIDEFQTRLQRRVLIENPSSYLRYRHSTIPEWEFLAAVAKRTGCGILCDVNNIFVSSRNHDWSPTQYLDALPFEAIGEIHLAGHSIRTLPDGRVIRVDDHGSRVCPAVWSLYQEAIARFGAIATLIEWDNDIPALDVLLDEARQADEILRQGNRNASRALAA